MSNLSQKDSKKPEFKNKKILYIITQSKWGGAQKYILDLAKYFSRQHEVHVAYGEKNEADKKFLNEFKKLDIKTIAVPYLTRKIDLGKDYLAIMEILKIYNEGKYDLVHLNSSKAGLLGALAAKMYAANLLNTKLRLVYTAHGFVFNEPLSKFKKKLYTFSEKISTNIQHLIITVSEADKQSAIDNKITIPGKIFTIHNGIDANNFEIYDKDKSLEKLNLDKNKKYFGTIASFYKTKGYIYLVEAVKKLKEDNSPLLTAYRWVLIGDGPEMDNIKKMISENKLDKYFHLLGAKEEAHKYLKAFDVFVLPSVKEGLPYAILEAGLAQIPIVASQVGGVGEILTDQKTGYLVTPANPLSLAKALTTATASPPEMVNSNYQNIRENFNLAKMLETTKETYKKLF